MITDGGQSVAILVLLLFFLASTQRNKTAKFVVCVLKTELDFHEFLLRTVRTKVSICMSVILWLPERDLIILDYQQPGVNYSHTFINTDTTE